MSTTLFLACLVIGVPDGDSLKVHCPARKAAFSVRLAEIDAPELEHKAFHIREQPGGRAAAANLVAMCLKQTAVVHKTGTDRYGRTLAKVECDGVNANEAQVRTGNAWAYMPKKRSTIPGLEARARAAHLGIWAQPGAVAPSTWRKAP